VLSPRAKEVNTVSMNSREATATFPGRTGSCGRTKFAKSHAYTSSGPAVMVVCPTSMRYPSGSRM
jgi:hypothetical protein